MDHIESKLKVVSAREDPDGRCVITSLPLDDAKVDFWVSCERGYTVEHFEMRQWLDEVTKEWSKVMLFGDVTWAEHDGVWIPTSIDMERNFNGREAYHATLEWESGNEDPPAKLFEPDGLGSDPEGIIVDRLMGDTAVVTVL